MLTLILILSFIVGLLFYAFIIEPRRLKERHYLIKKKQETVADISNAYDLYKNEHQLVIAHVSDFHFSKWFKPQRINRIIRSIMKTQPDLIIFTGDLIDDYGKWPHKSTSKLVEKLKKLSAPLGKIAVLGNHDYKNDGQYFVTEVLETSDFTVLNNETIFGANEDVSLSLSGIDAADRNVVYHHNPPFADWHLLLVHQPDYVKRVDNLKIYDLILSGHSHGGQIRLPFYQPKTAGALTYTDGIYLLGKHSLLSVSSGVGSTMIPARFSVPPEIIYYHLEKEEPPTNEQNA